MIVILTALELEGGAVRAHLRHVRLHHHAAGTVFEVGMLAARPDCEVALAVIGMGTANAAVITERAIAEFRPSAVLFVGIAGGLRNWIALGDVVVATRVHAYQGGRVDGDEFLVRPQSWDTSHRLVQLAKLVSRSKAWPGAEESLAEVHFEPIAAGEVVLNSTTAPEHARLRTHYNDAVAVEMESSGVALAGHLHESTPTAAVRGISDLADGNKVQADSGGWQTTAAANAAAFAVGLVAAIHENSSAAGTEPPAVAAQPVHVRHVHNTQGNAIGDITTQGPVKIKQSVVNRVRRHPVAATLIALGVVVVLGLASWGGYLLITPSGQDPSGSTAATIDQTSPEATVRSFATALTNADRVSLDKLVCDEERSWLENRLRVVDAYRTGTKEEDGVLLTGVTLSVEVQWVRPATSPADNGASYSARLAWTHGNLPADLDPELKEDLSRPDDWGASVRQEADGSWRMC